MKNAKELVILIIVLIYILSPVDLFPGPIDDVIVAIMGIKSLNSGK